MASSISGINWTAVQLSTGAIVADLPGIELASDLPVTIGQVESATLVLNISTQTPGNWLTATQPGGAALIAWTGDPASPSIIWGGIVRQRIRGIGPRVTLSCETPETYLNAAYVGNYTATSVNQDTILAALMGFASGTNQVPWVLNHLPSASTQTQSVSYASTSNVSVLSALQSLSAYAGGPEWTATWQWNLAARTIVPVLNYGARVGTPASNGVPAVTITSADLAAEAVFTEDYSEGYGANQVTAYGASANTASSSSSSTVIPTATGTAIDLKGRPLWRYVYQPSSSITDPNVLAQHAAAAVTQLQDGAQPLTLVMPRRHQYLSSSGWGPTGKQLGQDWNLGDDIGWNITGPAFPSPVAGVARAIGYRLTYDTITPILQGALLS